MCLRFLQSALQEWAAFQLESICMSIDFQYGTEAVSNLVRKYTVQINSQDEDNILRNRTEFIENWKKNP